MKGVNGRSFALFVLLAFLYRFLSKRVIAKGAKGSEEAIVRAREAIMSAVRKVNNCNGRYTHVSNESMAFDKRKSSSQQYSMWSGKSGASQKWQSDTGNKPLCLDCSELNKKNR